MKRILRALALILVAISSVRAEAQTLFAATGSNGVAGQLFTVDPASAAATLLGPLTINTVSLGCPAPPCLFGVTGLAFHPLTGVLYGVTGGAGGGGAAPIDTLVTIDPSTGVGTEIGPLVFQVGDISFNSSGTLYGWTTGPFPNALVTIDLTTALETLINGGSGPLGFTQGNGLSFVGSVLFLAPDLDGGETLFTVDPATGAMTPGPTIVGPLTPADVINAMATDGLGTLYGVDTNQGGIVPPLNTANLVSINPFSGIATDLGSLPPNTDALAFAVGNFPDLSITKTHSGNFFQGQTGATYSITVTNVGAANTVGTVTVTDAVPTGLTATGISGANWVCVQPSGPCTDGNTILPGGQSFAPIFLTVDVGTNAPPAVTNRATVSGGGDANPANNISNDITNVTPTPDLSITKTHVGNLTQGQTGATYTITVSNVGGAPTNGTLVTVTDAVPFGLTPVHIDGLNWTCTQPSGPCSRTDVLPASQSYPPLTLAVGVAGNAPTGSPAVTNQVTVSGGGDIHPANNTALDPTTIVGGTDLTITKTHVGNFTQGQTGATYTITVTNNGATPSSGLVVVSDTIPAGLTAMSISGTGWACAQPSGTCTRANALGAGLSYPALTLTANVAANAPASITNTAIVSGGGDVNAANNTANDITTVNPGSDLSITKTHVGNFTRGQIDATYTLTVTNVGAGPTNGSLVAVSDTLPAGLTPLSISGTGWACAQRSGPCTRNDALASLASYPALTLTVIVANAPIGVNAVTNTATVSGGGDVNPANNTASDPTTVSPGADLSITKTHVGNFKQGQSGAKYTITVTNVGAAPTNGSQVAVFDVLPAGLTATTFGGTGWTCAALPSPLCTRNDVLTNGQGYPPLTLTVNVAANAPASVTNSATVLVNGDQNGSNDTANDPTTVNSGADLSITKTHVGNFTRGQTGKTYTITVTNVGVGPTSGSLVVVSDIVPAGLTATSISGTGWACAQPSGPCTRANVLGAGLSYPPLTLTVSVAANAPASVTNTATVSVGGDTNPANNTANDPTTINAGADFSITKTHAGNFTRGQTGKTYTITVTNAGTGPTGTALVVVSDTVPAGLTATSISGLGWACVQPSGPCTRDAPVLASGASYQALTLTVDVAANAPDSVTNTATVSVGGDTNTANNTANDPTTINAGADLSITKTHAGNFAHGQAGAMYTITVTNVGVGPTSGSLVVVSDTVPAGLTPTAIAGTGWACAQPSGPCTRANVLGAGLSYPALTLTVSVGAGAVSPVTNTATVSGGGDVSPANNTANDVTIVSP